MAHRLRNVGAAMNRRARLESGYSLAEMLVVIAIIGIMTLISVPYFMSYYRTAKLKSSMRQVTSDFRSTRQRAVTKNEMTKLTVNIGVNPGTYTTWESTDGKLVTDPGKTWTQVGQQFRVQAPCFFSDSNIKDGTGTFADFVFFNDGSANVTVSPAATAILKTTDQIPTSQYTISVFTTGKVSVQ